MEDIGSVEVAVEEIAAEEPTIEPEGVVEEQPSTRKDTTNEAETEAITITEEPNVKMDMENAEPKSEKPLEEPILPDHFYDNGTIPVFKPVRCICISAVYLPHSRQWINFVVLKNSSIASMNME